AGVYPPWKPELQGPQRLFPISIRRAMIAIVTDQYFTSAEILNSPADSLPWLERPGSGRNGPYHHLRQPPITGSQIKLQTTKAKRWTHTHAVKAGRFQYRILATIQLIRDMPAAEEECVGMTVGVVSNDVLSRDNFCGQARILLYIFSENEESGCHTMCLE